jgi:membrane-associated phospholipid phosphatase
VILTKLLDLDLRYSDRLRIAEQPGWLRRFAAIFAHSGDSWLWLLGLGLVFFLGSAEWRRIALVMIGAILGGAVLVMAIKFTIRRQRPVGEWGGIYRATDPHSFPSGHATRAVMLAVLAVGLGPSWFAALMVIWAPMVALARVAMGVHYLSDVLAGAVLGLVLGGSVLWLILPAI